MKPLAAPSILVRLCPLLCASGLLAVALAPASAQTVSTWNGGMGNWSDGGFWTPSGAPNSVNADVRLDGGKTGIASVVNVDDFFTVGRLTIDAGDRLSINNGRGLTITDAGGFAGSGSLINNGSMVVESGGSYTDLFFNGTTSLSGTGTLTLQNAARVRGSGTLTNSSTIQGETSNSGSLGSNEIGLINAAGGLINANVSGLALVVDPNSASGMINQGTLRASGGGVLVLTGNGGGAFTNSGTGVIQALDGSQVQLRDDVVLAGGTLSTAGSGTVQTVTTATLTNVTNTGTFVGNNATTTTITGTLTNNGSFTLASTGSYTDLLVSSGDSATLAGSGTLNLQNAARVRGSGTLTNNSTIQGETSNSGSLGSNEIGLVNQSLVNANVSGLALVVDPNSASGLTNNGGTLRASAGGILQLSGNGGGSFNNAGGTIEALDNAASASEVQLVSGAAISGGTLNTTGNGVVRVTGGGSSLTTLTNAGRLIVNNDANITLSGTLTNNGSFTLASTGSYTDLLLGGDVTLAGTGTLNLQNAARVRGSGTLTNNSTIQGETSNSGSLGSNEIGLVNQSLVNANVSGLALVIDPSQAGNLTNRGTMQASNGGVLVLTGNGGGSFTNVGAGVIQALTGSEVQLRDGAVLSGGTLATAGSGVIRNLNTATLGTLTNTGTFIANDATGTTITGTLTNNGSFTLASTGSYTDLLVSSGDSATLAGSGTLNLQNADRVRGRGTFTNASTIQGETSNSGSLGSGESAIVNAVGALINANVNGLALNVTPSSTGGLTNRGTMQASNGGVLALRGGGGSFTNVGAGVIQALTGSEVQLRDGAVLSGGTLATAGSGVIRNLNTATLGTLTNTGTFIANDATTTFLAAGSTLTNNGSFTLASTGSYTDLLLGGDVTLAGTGTLNLQTAARVRGSGTLTNRSTIQGETSNSGSLGTGEINIINQGAILANVGNRLNIDPASSFNNAAGGIVRATGGSLAQFSGPAGAVTNNGVFVASGNNATVSVPATSLANYSNGTLTGGTFTASGTSASTPATVDLNGATVTTNAATVKLIGAGASIPAINSLATNQGTFALDGNRTFATAGALSNAGGTLAVARGSTLAVNGALTQTGGNLSGAGTISATGTLTVGGNVAPGAFALSENAAGLSEFDPANHTAGSLTLQAGSVVFTDAGSLTLSLGAPAGLGNVGANNDHLFVTGALTLDGTLNITARAGFGAGTYDLLDYSGAFTDNVLVLGTVPTGYSYQIVTSNPGQIDLVVTSVPEPSTWAGALLLMGGAVATYWQRRRQAA